MKTIHLEMECEHNQAERTMTLTWFGGVVKLIADWQNAKAVVFAYDDLKRRIDLNGMKIEEFMRIEEQCQESAEQLMRFERES